MLFVLAGPTASGKSALAVALAERIGAEIVSADSMQVYRGMDVGTAKIPIAERRGIPHYMIDVADPKCDYSVAEYAETAETVLKALENRGKHVVITGGTGLYVDALLYPFRFGDAAKNDEFRNRLYIEAEKFGNRFVYEKLKALRPEKAAEIHENNLKRVVRALEVAAFGNPEQAIGERRPKRPFLYFVILPDRELLYRRIDARVDAMIENGLEDELKRLIGSGVPFSAQSMQAIGYKEWKGYFEKTENRETVIENIKKNSRNYAKRQITWFKKAKNAVFFDLPPNLKNMENIVDFIEEYYNNHAK